jgi:hypothetical protein
MVSSIAGDLDHKTCFEVLTDEEVAARVFSVAERQLFRRHILWTRMVTQRETPRRTAGRTCRSSSASTARSSC